MADLPNTATNPARGSTGDADPAVPAPFRWEGWHIGASLPGGRVLFTTRRGGVSGRAHASLNLGRNTADEPARVRANRDLLAAQVGVAWSGFLHARQVHGAAVARTTSVPPHGRRDGDQDGQATSLHDAPALVLVADCLPVALVAPGAVAALHGGWRGLAAGILEEGVAALRDCGASGPVVAALGPCARSCCYEVGEEVHEHFSEPGARPGGRRLDLAAIARARLAAAGVEEIHDTGLCTMCSPALFFSHRRDAGSTGRQAGVAWRVG